MTKRIFVTVLTAFVAVCLLLFFGSCTVYAREALPPNSTSAPAIRLAPTAPTTSEFDNFCKVVAEVYASGSYKTNYSSYQAFATFISDGMKKYGEDMVKATLDAIDPGILEAFYEFDRQYHEQQPGGDTPNISEFWSNSYYWYKVFRGIMIPILILRLAYYGLSLLFAPLMSRSDLALDRIKQNILFSLLAALVVLTLPLVIKWAVGLFRAKAWTPPA